MPCEQAVLEECLVVVSGSKLEKFFRRDILPSFGLAFAQIAAACRALSSEVSGSSTEKVAHPILSDHLPCTMLHVVTPLTADAAAAAAVMDALIPA